MSDATPTRRNPYPGLRPFEAADKDVFFGRHAHADDLAQRLEGTRFLAVVGPSGSGKSSLVRAGLLPLLASGGSSMTWRIAILRPGGAPIKGLVKELVRVFPSSNILESEAVRRERLDASLRAGPQGLVTAVTAAAPAGEHCLVVIDAFEELFYLGDSDENSAFVTTLLDAAQNATTLIHVLITLGSDFLGDCTRFKGLSEMVDGGLYLVPRLSPEQLRAAVEGPARVAGGTMASAIIERIVRDAEEEEYPLPVLQYVLRRMWDSTATADVAEYDAMGGMPQAIAKAVDGFLNELPEEQIEVARKVFRCITYKVPDHRGVSRPTHFGEIPLITGESESGVRQVVEAFRAAPTGLMTPPAPEVLAPATLIEIAHEHLIRQWPTLQTWVDQEDSAANAYRSLMQSTSRHAAGRAGLWSGATLERAVERITRKEWNPHWAKRLGGNYGAGISFIEESSRARKADPGTMALRKSLGRARVFAVVLGVLFVASLGLAFFARHRQSEALVKASEANRLLAEALQQHEGATRKLDQGSLERDEADRQRNAALRQKEVAERQRKIAESRQRIAAHERSIVEREVESARARKQADRQLLYVANMNLADRAFDEGEIARGQEFLNAYLPAPAGAQRPSEGDDLRSFYWYYLWRDNHQELATLKGHGNAVATVAFSPDGKVLATGSRDGSVRLWNPAQRQELAVLKGSGQAMSSVAFSPDGKNLAAASRDGTVKLWDVTARKELATLAGEGVDVFAVAFSPNGKVLATGSKDGGVTLWDVETRAQLASLEGHERDVYAVVFSSDGKTLATGSQDDTVKLWEVASRKEIATLEGKGDDVHAVAFSPDGTLLASGNKNGTVLLWDVAGRKELASFEGTGRDVFTVAFSPTGQVLVAGTRDGAVKVWDVATRKELRTLKGHGDAVSSSAFAVDGQVLVTGSRDRTAKVWRLDTRQERVTLAGQTPIFSVAFSPDGKRLATGSVADTARLWNLASREKSINLKGVGDVLFTVAFSPDGAILATGSKDGTAKLWDLATGKEKGVLKGHGAVVFSVAFSPDGKTLATASWDRTVKLWDVAGGKETATLEGHKDAVFSVAFSPDGKVLATGSKDTRVKLWDAGTGKELATLAGHADAVFPVAFSPDGQTLVTASRDGIVKLWDVVTRTEVGVLKGHVDSVSSVFFSPDGKTLATGSLDDTVKLWDLATRQELATLRGHTNDVYSVAFSPDGKVLASGSLDGAVKLWEATTDEEVANQR